MPDAPTPYLVAAVVIAAAAVALFVLWWIWRGPVDKPVEIPQALAEMRPEHRAKVVAGARAYWNDPIRAFEHAPWPFPTWRVRRRPFDWRVD